jgi:hypothetical protein
VSRVIIHRGARPNPPRPIYTAQLHSIEGCRFIIGKATSPAVYCNQPRQDGSSYCAEHHRLTHAPPPHPLRVNGLSV